MFSLCVCPKQHSFLYLPRTLAGTGIEFVTPRSKALLIIGNGPENSNGVLSVLYVHRSNCKISGSPSLTVVRAAAVSGDAFYTPCSIISCWCVCVWSLLITDHESPVTINGKSALWRFFIFLFLIRYRVACNNSFNKQRLKTCVPTTWKGIYDYKRHRLHPQGTHSVG